MKAMIFAAGLGTRLKPFTDQHPKALVEVNGQSLLERNVKYLQQYGIKELVVNVHHFAKQIIEKLTANEGWGSQIIISDESEEVLETGGGLLKAAAHFKNENSFLVMNADILTDIPLDKLIETHLSHHHLATLAVSNRSSSRYFLFNEEGYLAGWKNTKTQEEKLVRPFQSLTPMAFSGIHMIQGKLFSFIQQRGKFSMVDVYLDLARNHPIGYFDHTGAKFIDVGKPESIEKAATMFL